MPGHVVSLRCLHVSTPAQLIEAEPIHYELGSVPALHTTLSLQVFGLLNKFDVGVCRVPLRETF